MNRDQAERLAETCIGVTDTVDAIQAAYADGYEDRAEENDAEEDELSNAADARFLAPLFGVELEGDWASELAGQAIDELAGGEMTLAMLETQIAADLRTAFKRGQQAKRYPTTINLFATFRPTIHDIEISTVSI